MLNTTRDFFSPISLIFCLSVTYNPIAAQSSIDTFDIATYARPDLVRKTFRLDPGFQSRDFYEKRDEQITEDLLFNGNFNFSATKFINSDRYQINQTISGEFLYSYDEKHRYLPRRDNIFARNEFNVFYSKKFFQEKDEFAWPDDPVKFFELGTALRLFNSFQRFKEINNDDKKIKIHFQLIELSLPFYGGTGRIEIINDAWHAIQILEFLDQQFLIKKEISKEEVRLFAYKVGEIKNMRHTDGRLQQIEQYEMLCKYLIDNELINFDDYRVFAHLHDAWRFESFLNRRSGKELKYGLVPSIRYSNTFSKEHDENSYRVSNSLIAQLQFNKYSPKGLKWQFNNSHLLEIEINNSKNQITFVDGLHSRNDLIGNKFFETAWSSSWEAQFLPNQRTNYSVSGRIGYRFAQNIEKVPVYEDKSFGFLEAGFRFDFNYYFSPNFRLNFRSNVFLDFDHINNKRFRYYNNLLLSIDYIFY